MTKLALNAAETMRNGALERFAVGGEGQPSAPFMMSRFHVEPNLSTPWDQHKEREIWIVLHGLGTVETDGIPIVIDAGDVIYFESQTPHRVTNSGIGRLSIASLWWPV